MPVQLSASSLTTLVEVLKGQDPAHLLNAVQSQINKVEAQLPADLLTDYKAFLVLEKELLAELNGTYVAPVAPVEALVEPVTDNVPVTF